LSEQKENTMKHLFFTSLRRSILGFHVALFSFILLTGTSQAQTVELPQQPYLPINLALEAASAALAQCQNDGYRVSVAVVDRSGLLKVLLRDDNTGPHTVSSSTRKAYTSASLGRSTQELATTVAENPAVEGLRQMDPQLLILAGGLPIVVNDAVVGGIGVGGAPGGNLDEACAQAGVDTILAAVGAEPEVEATAAPVEEATAEPAEEATAEAAEEMTSTPVAEEEATATPTP
jgi:uncharacterized protein GlcG (DUF336 family)